MSAIANPARCVKHFMVYEKDNMKFGSINYVYYCDDELIIKQGSILKNMMIFIIKLKSDLIKT